MNINVAELKFDEKGLIPAIIQDAQGKDVLMMAYMNADSIQKTVETGETWFWSRSRNELWHKGATSGNTQKVIDISVDCDADTLLVKVIPAGPACHENTYTCFHSVDPEAAEKSSLESNRYNILSQLETLIATRDAERPEGAYTTYLFEKGVDKILKKVGEETAEVIIAAKNRSHDELRYEASDLIYHLFVLLREQKLPFEQVLLELAGRYNK
jgi:phosphoribosyl-AMP cyclohydrolase / phosphoribosyl-ATP pyrophosphohydrolase